MKKLLATTAIVLALGFSGAHAEEGKMGYKHGKHFEEALSKLPEDKAALVKASFEKTKAASKADREAVKAAREEIKAILVAPTFDKEAFLKKSAEVQALHAKMHETRTQSMAEVASQLNVEERKILVDSFPKHHGKRKGHENTDVPSSPEERE